MSKSTVFKSEKAKVINSLCMWGTVVNSLLLFFGLWLYCNKVGILSGFIFYYYALSILWITICSLRNGTLEEKFSINVEKQKEERNIIISTLIINYTILTICIILSLTLIFVPKF